MRSLQEISVFWSLFIYFHVLCFMWNPYCLLVGGEKQLEHSVKVIPPEQATKHLHFRAKK